MATTAGAEASDIAAQLDTAIDGTEDSPTPETGKETTTENESKGKAKAVPYERFKEVIEDKNTLKAERDQIKEKYLEQTTTLANLTKMLETAKSDVDLVREIKDLQRDPAMLPHLEAIDRKLKGIEAEVEETGNVDKDKVADVQKLIKAQKAQLDEQMQETRSEMLITRADQIADQWLGALPEEYTDQDRKVISKLWANEVDWNILENQPEKLNEHLRETFKSVINDFGVPRGKLIDPDDPDSYTIEIDEPEKKSIEDELMEAIGKKDYGKILDVEKGGKKSRAAAVSDDEFAADMAKILKTNRR